MRVTIFTAFNTALNPYILLFKGALENQGIKVQFERNFNLNWLIFKGKSCDCIHLHWLGLSHTPPKMNGRPIFLKIFFHNRFVKAFLDFIRLIEFALTFLFAKLAGKIIVFTVHDLYEFGQKSLRWKFQIEMARKIVFRFSNSIHAHNYFTSRLIESKYKRKSGIAVIPHGNYIGYYPNQIPKAEARRQLGLPGDAFIYLFLGLLRPYKGLEDLLAGFKKLNGSKARLLVAGRVFGVDNYESRLKALVLNDSRIKIVPEFIPDEAIQVYLNACDIFVLPYKDITTSGAASLALSFGRPILAPDITSFSEVVTKETGVLYESSQANALTLALKEARNHNWSESRILDYAHQFDWDRLGPQLVGLYNKKLERSQ